MLSIFASNLGANLIPWGADTSILMPKYINIRRGMYISYILALCICPWKILKSSTTFLRFLGGYSVFLGPLVGIAITDYFVIRRGNVYISDLFTSDPKGKYWYTYGVNWRAAAAFLVAVVLPIPGFATLFGQVLPQAWVQIYLIGCVLSSFAYFGLCKIGQFAVEEQEMRFEEVADQQILIDVADRPLSVSEMSLSEIIGPEKMDTVQR
jgi:NCS1 family nucleobase:cation symporter-1